jgi:ABC-2 type transport system permease protein
MSTLTIYWWSYQGLVQKQIRRFARSWVQNLLPSVVTAGLFMLIFGHFVGRDLGRTGGAPYADFIMPGLVMFAVVTNAYNNTTLAFFGARLQRHIEELLVAPMPAWLIVAGFVTASVLRGLLAGGLVLLLALPFTELHLHDPATALGIAVVSATLFAFAGLINGVFARSFDDTSVIATFLLTPLTYLGGVFYPVDALPAPWDRLSLANPMVYIVDGFRHGLLDAGAAHPPLIFAALLAVTAATGALAWWLVARGIRIKP